MKNLLILLVSLVAICETTTAQNICNRWYIDINYTYLEPLKDFRINGFQRGHGFSIGGYYELTPNAQKATLHTGFRFNRIFGKNAKGRIALADPVGAEAKTKVHNTILDGQALARIIFQPQAKVSPYLGAHGGFRFITGRERLNIVGDYSDYDDKTTNEAISRGNWIWGGNIGGLVRLNSIIDFDIRLSADYSPELEYIDMNSYEEIEDNLIYDFSETKALNLKLHIGIRAKLICRKDPNQRRRSRSRTSSPSHSTKKSKKRKPSKKKRTTKSSSRS